MKTKVLAFIAFLIATSSVVANNLVVCNEATNTRIGLGQTIVIQNFYFDVGKSDITPRLQRYLAQRAAELRGLDYQQITIIGHTDNTGSIDSNIKLSYMRARNVAMVLINNDIDRARVVYKGFGPNTPIASNTTEEGRQANRRVEISVD